MTGKEGNPHNDENSYAVARELQKEVDARKRKENEKTITDSDTNTIVVSALLETKFPRIFGKLKAIVETSGEKFHALPETHDIWCRDYFPIQRKRDSFVKYKYDPDYLKNDPQLITREIDFDFGEADVTEMQLTLDGGNLMKGLDFVLLTEKVFSENNAREEREKRRVAAIIKAFFGEPFFFPVEPYDPIGHIDGEVMLVDKTLFVNDYSEYLKDKQYAKFAKELKRVVGTMMAQGLISRVVELPYTLLEPENELSCVGCYVNFLHFGKTIILPRYSALSDPRALEIMEAALPEFTIHTIECTDLARDGGALHCVTAGIFA